jgi:hypothetical protein
LVTASFTFNGTSWTSTPSMNSGRRGLGGCGTQTAALAVGGGRDFADALADTEEYNGSSWTTQTALPGGRGGTAVGGIQTAALQTGGYDPGITYQNTSFAYNGSSWTAGGNMSQARGSQGMFGPSSSLQYVAGGYFTAALTATEKYNGTSFSSETAIPAASYIAKGVTGASSNNGFLIRGNDGSAASANTFNFTGAGVQTRTITTS